MTKSSSCQPTSAEPDVAALHGTAAAPAQERSRFVQGWLDFLDRWVPPAIAVQGPEQALRAQTTVVAGLLACVLWTGSGVLILALGEPWLVPVAGLASSGLVMLWLMASRGVRSQLVFAAPLLGVAYVQLSTLWFGSGFTNVGALFGYSVAPSGRSCSPGGAGDS